MDSRVNNNVSHEADMNARRILLVLICGFGLTGCKSTRQNQELLERELRWQEDRIYELENALDEEIRLQIHCFLSEDCLEGLNAFFEKRKAVFKGH